MTIVRVVSLLECQRCPKINENLKPFLNYGCGPGYINHSRIRMGLKCLNQRYPYTFIDYRHCTTSCNAEKKINTILLYVLQHLDIVVL